MSIAEKLITVAENDRAITEAVATEADLISEIQSMVDNLPEAGGDTTLSYATTIASMFEYAVFPGEYELTLSAPLRSPNIGGVIRGASGIRKLTLDIPTSLEYSAVYLVYQSSVEELVLPDGIHFTSWNYFATNVKSLKSVFGRIDARGSASNTNTFNGCNALVDVSFIPNTIESTITFAHSANLSAASIQSIVDGLADLTGSTAQTLTLHADVGAKLTQTQKDTIAAKNWTVTY